MQEYAEQFSRYRQIRELGRELSRDLVKRIPKALLLERAKALGLVRRGVLVFSTEDESCVLMDHCLYFHRPNRPSVVDQYASEFMEKSSPDEKTLLQAMRQAHFSIFSVERAVSGFGVDVIDIFSNERFFLFDQSFSRTARRRTVLASRIIVFEGIHMTTGAALPMSREIMEPATYRLIDEMGIRRWEDLSGLSPADRSRFETIVLQSCLQHDAASHIGYHELDQPVSSGTGMKEPTQSFPRNAPCPCGSGKKYKKCCG
jgi:hypothetical protein